MKSMKHKKTLMVMAGMATMLLGSVIPVHAEENVYHYLTLHNESDATYQAQKAVEDLYRKEVNPDFRIERTVVSDRTAYLQKLKTLVAANDMPDIFDEDADPYVSKLASVGAVANIGDFLKEAGQYDAYVPVTLKYQTFDEGEMYLLPTAFNAEYFWYNKQIFEDNNLEIPKTMDELMEVCQKLKDAGITPISVGSTDKWPLLRYLGQYPFRMTGNQFIEDASKGLESFTSDVGLAGINYLQKLGTNGYFQEGFGAATNSDAIDYFLGGKAAIYYTGTWDLGLINESEIADNISFFVLPMIDDAKTNENDMWAGGGTGICFKQETFDDEIQNYLKFYNEHYGDFCFSVGGFFPPIETDLPEDVPALTAEVYNNMLTIGEYGKCWDVVLDSETFDYMGNQAIALALGQISAEDFAVEMDDTVQRNAVN